MADFKYTDENVRLVRAVIQSGGTASVAGLSCYKIRTGFQIGTEQITFALNEGMWRTRGQEADLFCSIGYALRKQGGTCVGCIVEGVQVQCIIRFEYEPEVGELFEVFSDLNPDANSALGTNQMLISTELGPVGLERVLKQRLQHNGWPDGWSFC